MKRKIVSILLVGLLILSVMIPTFAASSAQQKKEELEDQLSNTKNEKKQVTNEKNEVLDQISDLDSQIAQYENEISKLNKKITDLEKSITEKEKEIKKLEKEYTEKEELLEERIVAMYEAGETTYLDVLLSSSDLVSFISNYYMVEQLVEADQEVLKSIQDQQTKIETAKRELEEQKKEISTAKKEVELKTTKLNSTKVQKQSKVNELSDKEKKLQAKIEEFNKEIKKAQKQIEEELRNSGNDGKYQGSFSGELSWPVSYSAPYANYISSYFGKRPTPTAGASSNHGAVDIPVSYQSVFAPAAGKVIIAKWLPGYGNYVMIDHGNGTYTGFGHLSGYSVSKGAVVSRGQKIATSGNTGVSTGPHLHYEVYKGGIDNGYRVDPLQYTSHPTPLYSL